MAVQITFRVPMTRIIDLVATKVDGADYTINMFGQEWFVTYHRNSKGTYFLATQTFSMQMKLVHKLERMLTKAGINSVVGVVEEADYA